MIEEQENGQTRQLRPRRSVLTDISNKIAGGIANVTGKTVKKRKLSVSIHCFYLLLLYYISHRYYMHVYTISWW